VYAIDDFLHVAVSTAKRFKRKFTKTDYDELLSDAYLHLLQAFKDADKSKTKGELDVFIRSRITWRLTDELRRKNHLWVDEDRRVKVYSLNRLDADSGGFDSDLEGAFFASHKANELRVEFLSDVRDIVEIALFGKPELAFMFDLTFVKGLTDKEIKEARHVSLKVVRAKRIELIETIKPYLRCVNVGKRSKK